MLKKNDSIQNFLYVIFLLFIGFHLHAQSKIITNTMAEIDACEGKIKLTLARVWGEDDTEDINQVFRCPSDIKIDSMGRIFILDSWNHRIQVFDDSGKFIRTIGRMGKGPSDLLNPVTMTFTKAKNIVVADSDNFRIQIFGQKGEYISSFRTGKQRIYRLAIFGNDEILMYLPKKNEENMWALSSYNLQGKPVKEIYTVPSYEETSQMFVTTSSGITKKKSRRFTRESLGYFVDNNDNIFISYGRVPVYLKLSPNGKLLMASSYETPLKMPEFKFHPKSSIIEISGERKDSTIHDLFVDGQGRTFLIAKNRKMRQEEIGYMVGDGNGQNSMSPKRKEYPKTTDVFRLLVFNADGKIIAAKKMTVYCEKIYLHKNRLFIIDRLRNMEIYEYKFEI